MSQLPTKSFPKVRQVKVSADEAGQRIDNFLARYLKGVPKSHIYRILRRGEVRVNSGRIRAQYKVCAGDTVRIPPVRVAPPRARPEKRPVSALSSIFCLKINVAWLSINRRALPCTVAVA